MTKFLVTYMGSEAGKMPGDISQEESAAFMQAWGDWADRHKSHIVDGGAPVGKTKLVSTEGITDTANAITGYSIIEADSHYEAARMFTDHPHVAMLEHRIEVMECPPIPGM